jgi:hypothetical protein
MSDAAPKHPDSRDDGQRFRDEAWQGIIDRDNAEKHPVKINPKILLKPEVKPTAEQIATYGICSKCWNTWVYRDGLCLHCWNEAQA